VKRFVLTFGKWTTFPLFLSFEHLSNGYRVNPVVRSHPAVDSHCQYLQ